MGIRLLFPTHCSQSNFATQPDVRLGAQLASTRDRLVYSRNLEVSVTRATHDDANPRKCNIDAAMGGASEFRYRDQCRVGASRPTAFN